MMAPSAWGYSNMGYAEWAYYQQQYAAAAASYASQQQKSGYQPSYVPPYQYYYPNCHPNLWVDTSSLPRSIPKSTSTPTRSSSPRSSPSSRSRSSVSSQHSLSSFHDPRPSRTSSSSSSTVSGASSTEFSSGRRSSITSISSSVSGMSVSSKRSFSRRIKEVFKGKNESDDTRVRRRSSIAALSGLFQKHNNVPTTVPEEESDQDPLPAPPSPPFVKSSCPTPPRTPTISSNVSTLSSSSTSSSSAGKKKKIQFYPTIQVHETFSSSEYDRRCDTEATCQKLTPTLAVKIKQELNEYKLTDMEVHVESRRYTHFLL